MGGFFGVGFGLLGVVVGFCGFGSFPYRCLCYWLLWVDALTVLVVVFVVCVGGFGFCLLLMDC